MVDLAGRRPVQTEILQATAEALRHRGPDDDGFLYRPRFAQRGQDATVSDHTYWEMGRSSFVSE